MLVEYSFHSDLTFAMALLIVLILGMPSRQNRLEFWPRSDDRAKSRDFQQWDERRNKGDVEA
jgi:hypothetical protein